MSEASGINTASSIQADYMKLLISQLQNQDPLEPLDNNEMASQLAQFSQLQQIESMNTNFAQVLVSMERSYASSLIGKEVSFLAESESGMQEITGGVVEEVYYDVDGEILLVAGDRTVNLKDVISVKS
ncbi:MAG: hypothetical protein JSU94_11960 [Phycisphaerales bacterium]|nr:MAG: hypothetical protein JSU94_11960 [Phycisphaerales bacterium]